LDSTLRPLDLASAAPLAAVEEPASGLGSQPRGFRGVVFGIRAADATASGGLSAAEMERRLLEMGFVEGAVVEILHEGLFGRDPIAVKVDDMRVALRRRDARGVLVRAQEP
jgi:ferrous iron transport protein A